MYVLRNRLKTVYRLIALTVVVLLGIVSTLGSSSSSDSSPTPAPPVTLSSISVSPAALPDNLPIDVTQQFTATGSYSNNTKQDLTKSVTWNSSATATATIDANGLATGVAAGTSNITASLSGKTSNTVAVTVVNPTLLSLTVTPATVPSKLQVGRTQIFKAAGAFDNNKTYDVTNYVSWNSSNQAAATVAATGVATGVAQGTTDITASTTTPAVTSNTVALEVTLPTATSVIIEPQTFDPLPVNRKQQFKAYLVFSDDSVKDITNTSTWASDDTAIATVVTNPNNGPLGQVTGVAAGTATITATDNNSSLAKTVSVTVNDAIITTVNIIPASPNDLPAGFTQEFTAEGEFSDSKTRKLSDSVAWSLSDTSVAIFEERGATAKVAGLSAGSVEVKYTDLLADGKESSTVGTSNLTVTNAILNSIATNPSANFSFSVGGQTNFTAIGSYSDSSGRDITEGVIWESGTIAVGTFDTKGKFTALTAGTTAVKAKAENTAVPPVVIESPTVTVTVVSGTLQTLTIQPQLDPEQVGLTRQFHVTGTYDNGNTSGYTQRVTWTSSDTAVATVSNDFETKGQVTGVAAGFATLTATDPETSISGTLNITVSQP